MRASILVITYIARAVWKVLNWLELMFTQEDSPRAGAVLSPGAHLAVSGDIFSCHN